MNMLALDLTIKCFETKDPYLDLGMCGLRDEDFVEDSSLDIALRKCTHLQKLVLSNTWTDWNEEIKTLESRNSGEKNYFTTHPPALLKLADLTSFVCCGELGEHWKITDMSFVENLDKLTVLDLSSNQISEIKGLEKLVALTTLKIYSNQITEIKGLENLVALTTLNLLFNQISEIKGLENLVALTTLDLSANQISEINGLENLVDLTTLYLSSNQISEIKGLENLVDLAALYLSGNQISEINGLENLIHLTTLYLSVNQIREIKGLDSLSTLQKFDISRNQITDITPLLKPYLLRKKSPLQIVVKEDFLIQPGEINVKDNPLKAPPMEIVQQGNDAVLYWCAAQDQGKVVNHETKIIFFGNGRSGKTTLSHMLRTNKFVPLTEKDRTHGILIETWDIPKNDLPGKLKQRIAENIQEHDMRSPRAINTPASFQIHLWDFGGQEYYHPTHRLFMSNNILYLLIWETATNHQYESEKQGQFDYPVSYWQKNINHFSPQNTTLCVQNKAKKQEGNTDDLHYKIERRNKNDKKSIRRFEIDIEALREGILEHLTNISYIGELSPQVYDDIRQVLRKVESPYISYTEYKKLCEANDSTPSRIMQDDAQKETLIRFLDDTGALICFRFRKGIETSTLEEHVFTDPVWLTKIIYKILEKGKAEFVRQHVEEIVFNDGLDATLWIEIMKQFELIFEIEEGNEKKYVVPQYLPETCINQKAYDIGIAGKKMEHAFTLNYPDFLPKSNFLRLLAKYGKQNISYLYWKKGMLFFLNNKTVFAECIITAEIRKIIISIQDRDETTTKEIFKTLIAIDKADDLQVSVNEKDFVEVKKLREKFHNNNAEIDSVDSNTLQVSQFNMLFEKKKEEPKTRQVFISYAHDDILFKEELQSFLINIEREGLINIWQDELLMAGENWNSKIKEAMEKADICILLLSQSLISSSYGHGTEFKTIMEKRAAGTTLIIPVLIKECDWKNWKVYPNDVANKLTEDEIKNYSIGTFQFLPINDKKRVKPLDQWRYKGKAWIQVGEAIRKFCTDNKYW